MRGGGIGGEIKGEKKMEGRVLREKLCEKGDLGPEVGVAPQKFSARKAHFTLSPLTYKKLSTPLLK